MALLIISPWSLAAVINPGYDHYPDHKGAAKYIKSLDLPANAIVIAEDVLQQKYYLGSVDYWLCEIDNAGKFSIERDGQPIDWYTATPVIGDGSQLQHILDENHDQPVYIVGSGENFENGRRNFRGRGISEVLDSDQLEVVFIGRDNKTRIWRLRNDPLEQ
jgi:hypothetical protein